MHEPFNPYVAWLGIAQARGRPNHYALLGLALFESDAARIAAAAERQMAKVFKVQAGAQQALWQRLLAEIGEAKQTFSDPMLKQRYDEELRRQIPPSESAPASSRRTGAPPAGVNLLPPDRNVVPPSSPARSTPPKDRPKAAAPSEALAAPQPSAGEFTDLADPMAPVDELLPPEATVPARNPAPQPAAVAQAREEAAPATPQLSGMRSVGYGMAIRRRRGQERLLVALMALLVLAAAGMAVGYVTGFIRFGASGDVALTSDGSDDQSSDGTANGKASGRSDEATNGDSGAQDSTTAPAGADGTGVKQPTEAAVKFNGSSTQPKPNDGSNGTTSVNAANRDTPSEVRRSDPVQVAKFQGALAAARGALGRRDYAAAKARIDQAKQLAVSDEQNAMANGFESLAEHVKGFWDAVREGTEGLESAGELQIGSTIVSIVEVGKEHLIIRAAGQNRRHALDQLPAGLAVAIAKRWFDARADNKVILGAFHFVDPRTDVADAKRLWEEAAGAGLDVKRLLSLLPIAEVKEPTDESGEP